jgi:hypothetical protein
MIFAVVVRTFPAGTPRSYATRDPFAISGFDHRRFGKRGCRVADGRPALPAEFRLEHGKGRVLLDDLSPPISLLFRQTHGMSQIQENLTIGIA